MFKILGLLSSKILHVANHIYPCINFASKTYTHFWTWNKYKSSSDEGTDKNGNSNYYIYMVKPLCFCGIHVVSNL